MNYKSVNTIDTLWLDIFIRYLFTDHCNMSEGRTGGIYFLKTEKLSSYCWEQLLLLVRISAPYTVHPGPRCCGDQCDHCDQCVTCDSVTCDSVTSDSVTPMSGPGHGAVSPVPSVPCPAPPHPRAHHRRVVLSAANKYSVSLIHMIHVRIP